MMLSDKLKRYLAQEFYQNARRMLPFENIKPWAELASFEQKTMGESIQIMLGGAGSNEVLQTWFKRSGHMPFELWKQVNGNTSTAWELLVVQLMSTLITLANTGIIVQEEIEGEA